MPPAGSLLLSSEEIAQQVVAVLGEDRLGVELHALDVVAAVAQVATQIHTVVGLVGAELGVAVVPSTARNLRPRNVRFVQLADKAEPVHVALAWRRGQETPAILAFRRVTQDVVASLRRP